MRTKTVRLLALWLALFLALTQPLSVSAQESDEAQRTIDRILAYELHASSTDSVETWIGELSSRIGESAEWYLIALNQYGDYDSSAYETALLAYLSQNPVGSASSRLKYALTLAAIGSTDSYISETLNEAMGEQGIMSWIFGLHLLKNGYASDHYSQSDVLEILLSMQLSDGGFAVTGEFGDVDVTAMTLQALAPYYEESPAVKTSVDRALEFLSGCQQDTGDYASYGVCNPESTAQVLTALSALGIDAKTDSRFLKNGNSVFDGIFLYELPDGSFSHRLGGDSSTTATVQVFYAMVSYLRMEQGKGSLYCLDQNASADPSPEPEPEDSTFPSDSDFTETETAERQAADSDDLSDHAANSGGNVKLWVCVTILLLAGGGCILLRCFKKGSRSNDAVILGIAAVGIVFVVCTEFQSKEAFYAASSKEEAIGTVTLTIRCDAIEDRSAEHIPDDGVILDTVQLEIEAGDTVYDLLLDAAAAYQLYLETSGAGEAVYVQGIANIYELEFGELSGWVYSVNGVSPSVSCGAYALSADDEIQWIYTCRLGEDLT